MNAISDVRKDVAAGVNRAITQFAVWGIFGLLVFMVSTGKAMLTGVMNHSDTNMRLASVEHRQRIDSTNIADMTVAMCLSDPKFRDAYIKIVLRHIAHGDPVDSTTMKNVVQWENLTKNDFDTKPVHVAHNTRKPERTNFMADIVRTQP